MPGGLRWGCSGRLRAACLTRWHVDMAKQTVSGGHGKQTHGCWQRPSPPRHPRRGGSGTGVGRLWVPQSGEETSLQQEPAQDQGHFQPAVSATQISVAISDEHCRKEQQTQPRVWMGKIRTTPHFSFNRNSLSLNMNQTATLGGAPCLSNVLHQRGTEITRGLASFQASLALL